MAEKSLADLFDSQGNRKKADNRSTVEAFRDEQNAKTKEETHVRITFLMDADSKRKIDELREENDLGWGFQSYFINKAIENELRKYNK